MTVMWIWRAMLSQLSIRDIVLIDRLDIDFAEGLAVLSALAALRGWAASAVQPATSPSSASIASTVAAACPTRGWVTPTSPPGPGT